MIFITLIIVFMFGATIADLTLFLLNILWRRWFLGKSLSSRFKIFANFYPKISTESGVKPDHISFAVTFQFSCWHSCTLIFVDSQSVVIYLHRMVLINWVFCHWKKAEKEVFPLLWENIVSLLFNRVNSIITTKYSLSKKTLHESKFQIKTFTKNVLSFETQQQTQSKTI